MMQKARLIRAVRLGIKNLMLHKLRSLLTVLGLVFGVGSVIAMLSVGEGGSRQALREIRKLGSNNIILQAMKPTEDESSSMRRVMMSIYGLTYEDEKRIRESVPTVKRTVPAKFIRKDARLKERMVDLRVVGTTPGWFSLVNRELLAGRVLTDQDQQDQATVCVLTETGARKLTATEYTVGQMVQIGGYSFEIVGIVKSEQGNAGIATPDQEIDGYIPLMTARKRYGDRVMQRTEGADLREMVELNAILVEVDTETHVEATAEALGLMLTRFHKRKDYKVDVPLALLKQAEASKRMWNIVLGSIAGISLLVGGIGIMNIMLATVTERTREIGIRRAIGARQSQIIQQFMVEAVVLSFVGGCIGIVVGLVFPLLITAFSGMPTTTPLWSVLLSLGISVSVGIVFGLYPAIQASRLDPIVALRHE